MMRRLGRGLMLLIALSAAVWGARFVLRVRASTPAQDTAAVDVTSVRRGPFVLRITGSGKLRARSTVTVRTQQVQGFGMMFMMESKLTWIAPDGQPIKKGDVLARLDDADFKRQVRDIGLEYANGKADAEKASRDQALQQRNSQAAVDKAKEEKRILDEANKVQIKQAQEQVDYANSELLRLTTEYNRKKKQEEEKLLPLTKLEEAESAMRSAAFQADKAQKDLQLQTEKANSAAQEKQTDIDNAQFTVDTAQRQAKDAAESAQAHLKDIKRRLDDAQQMLNTCVIRTPSSGLVVLVKEWRGPDGRRVPRAGDQLRPFEPLADIPDLSGMAIDCKVPEREIGAVHPGQPVIVRLDELPTRAYHARVTQISSVAEEVSAGDDSGFDPGTRVFTVTVELREHDPKRLLPGMNASLEITTRSIPVAVSVPKNCVFDRGADHVVYVRSGAGFKPVAITPGEENETDVRILHGLHGGESIATSDPTRVVSGGAGNA